MADGGQRIRHGHLGMITAHADTFAAVNAALINNMRAASPHPDRLRGAALQARGAALALADFK